MKRLVVGTPSSIPVLSDFSSVQTSHAFRTVLRMASDTPPPPPGGGSAQPVDTSTLPGVALSQTVQAFVNGLSLSTFGSDVTTERRSAVLQSFLFAQLAANGDVKNDPSKNWIQQCISYLPTCGFALIQSSTATYNAGGLTVRLDKALLDSLEGALDVKNIDIIKTAINALETLPQNAGALTLFDHNTIRGGLMNIANISVAQPNGPTGILAVTFNIYSVAFKSSETRVLWVDVNDSDSKLDYSTATFALDDDIYTSVKDKITGLLTPHLASTVAPVLADF